MAQGLIILTGADGGQFQVFYFQDAFITDLSQPLFEGFSFGGGDGLDDTEDALRVGAVQFCLPPAVSTARVGANCPHPLERPGSGRCMPFTQPVVLFLQVPQLHQQPQSTFPHCAKPVELV